MKITAFVTALILCASPVVAQTTPTADFALTVGSNLDRDENFKRAASSFALPVSGAFGLQADLAISKYETAESITPSGALHATWQASPDFMLGAFFVGETPDDETIVGFGLEAAWDSGPLRVEGYVTATQAVNDSSQSGNRAGLDLTYRFDGPISVRAGAHNDSFDGTDQSFVYLGAGWDVTDTMTATALYGQTDAGDDVISFGVHLATGPVPFGRRDISAGLPGY